MSKILSEIDVNNYTLQSMSSEGGGSTPNLQSKDITINQNGTTTVTADSGYDGLSDVDVTVNGILDTSDATAVASDIARGKTAYVNGEKVTGNIVVANDGLYAEGNLSPRVDGNNKLHFKNYWNNKFVLPSNAPVELVSTGAGVATAIGLTPEKLKKDETILGVTGTLEAGIDTSDATAVASDIAIGKTAYANGVKLVGTSESVDDIFLDNIEIDKQSTNPQAANLGLIIEKIPKVLTITGTSAKGLFQNCSKLKSIKGITGTNITNSSAMFAFCSSLIEAPFFDTSKVTDMNSKFCWDNNLISVPEYDMTLVTTLQDCFVGCSKLSNDSLNNIINSLLSLTAYNRPKTLKEIGLSSTQANYCVTLQNWTTLVANGWSTGY